MDNNDRILAVYIYMRMYVQGRVKNESGFISYPHVQ